MRLLTIDQFAKECGVNVETIRLHVKAGKIKTTGKYPTIINADKYLDIISYYAKKKELSKVETEPDEFVTIYGLKCPEDGYIKYIGRTKNPTQRFKIHCEGGNSNNAQLCFWIRGLKSKQKLPEFITLATCDTERAPIMESEYIHKYNESFQLFNINQGLAPL